MITNIHRGFVKIENKYVIPFSGKISIIKNIFTLVFRSQTDCNPFFEELSNFFNKNYDKVVPLFKLSDINRELNDIQMDGYYDYEKNIFIETLFSPMNSVSIYILHDLDYTLTPTPLQPYIKIYDNNLNFYFIDFKINFVKKNTDENYRRSDFSDVLNIDNKSYQNKPKQYQNKWLKRIDFYNVLDSHFCKIYSSIAEQSLHNYIGRSSMNFIPIKRILNNYSSESINIQTNEMRFGLTTAYIYY